MRDSPLISPLVFLGWWGAAFGVQEPGRMWSRVFTHGAAGVSLRSRSLWIPLWCRGGGGHAIRYVKSFVSSYRGESERRLGLPGSGGTIDGKTSPPDSPGGIDKP
jgi:hypothetical protein